MIDFKQKLSSHFTFGEVTTTESRKLIDQNRIEAEQYLNVLTELCEKLLEPIRVKFGPVVVHSGFRCKKLNSSIGGSKTSQHMVGQAADLHVVGHTLESVFDWIRKESSLKVGQCILEGWSAGNPSWIHISLGEPYRDPAKCGQFLTFNGKRYVKVKT